MAREHLDIVDLTAERSKRRLDILAKGIGLADLEEYNVLTLQIVEAAPQLLRALADAIALRDELLRDESTVSAVSRAFANEIDRALKGQRR